MGNVFLHLGMHKTGTTFLQTHCFPHLRDVHFVEARRGEATGFNAVIDDIIYTNPPFFDPAAARERARALLAEIGESTLLISRERLFGYMTLNYRDNFYIAEMLRKVFPGARLILVVRRQDDLIESIYRQLLYHFFYQTVNGFINYRDGDFRETPDRPGQPSVDVREFDLYVYVKNYIRLFGSENVLVLPYELMRGDQRSFLDQIYRFLGCEAYYPEASTVANRSYSLPSCYIALILNRFVKTEASGLRLLTVIPEEPFTGFLAAKPCGRGVYKLLAGVNRRLSLRYWLKNGVDRLIYVKGRMIDGNKRRRIMAFHAESNRLLDEELGLGLERHGYY